MSASSRLYEVHPQGRHPVLSGRLYEYFTCIYSQERECIQDGIDLGKDYRSECLRLKRRHFQPFRKGIGEKYKIYAPKDEAQQWVYLLTSDSQLNFLNWVVIRNVDRFILSHLEEIKTQKVKDKGKFTSLHLSPLPKEVGEKQKRTKKKNDVINGPADNGNQPVKQRKSKRKNNNTSDVESLIDGIDKLNIKPKKKNTDVTRAKPRVTGASWHHPPPGKNSFEKRLGV
jgi:hypothetical protein